MNRADCKFYIASPKMVNDVIGWRKKTLKEAISQAKDMLDDSNAGEILIVKVVAIVKPAARPIRVEMVK